LLSSCPLEAVGVPKMARDVRVDKQFTFSLQLRDCRASSSSIEGNLRFN
jgi:hypothetical protein